MNSDIKPTKNWLIPLYGFIKSSPHVGIVQPKIKSFNNPDYFEYAGAAGGYLDIMGLPYCRGRIGKRCEKDIGQYDQNTKITWASGACFLINNSLFQKAGGFDPEYFMHFEEIDLCLRVQNLGFEIWFIENSEVFHIGAASLLKNSSKKLYYNIRNSLITYTKTLPIIPLIWVYKTRLALDLTMILYFMIQLKFNYCYVIISAYNYFFRNWFRIFKNRNKTINKLKFFSILFRL
jgi:hypothetical protein